jgi:hypothetical protein
LPEGTDADNPDRLSSTGPDIRITVLNCTTSQAANNEIIKMTGSATLSVILRPVLLPKAIPRPFSLIIDD